MKTRASVLERAKETITQDRNRQYGEPEDNFKTIAGAWSWYLERNITAQDVAMMMCLFKLARLKADPTKEDSWVDLCGYAACGAECSMGGNRNGNTD